MTQRVAMETVEDPDRRCAELRAEVLKLAKLLERPKPALMSWHDKVRQQIARVNELYPTGVMVR